MIDFKKAYWINEPKNYEIKEDRVSITTDPSTDFWQRTYYGFRNDNSPGLLINIDKNFTFTTKVEFEYSALFEQCGLLIYIDSDNWFKVSIEYENKDFSRLGSVVTNSGYSDWATTDIKLQNEIWFRLSRRGPDFLIESSFDGENFHQMRVFHFLKLGETTLKMGKSTPPFPAINSVPFGLYASSPLSSSFTAVFSEMKFEECKWKAHKV